MFRPDLGRRDSPGVEGAKKNLATLTHLRNLALVMSNKNITVKTAITFQDINGRGEKETASFYSAALAMTGKQTRHLAIDSSGKYARRVQRYFAGFANRLCKLVSRDFPGAVIHFHWVQGELSKRANGALKCMVWVVAGGKIVREFSLSSVGECGVDVVMSQYCMAHPGAVFASGKVATIGAGMHHGAGVAARKIKQTPAFTYAGE